MPDNKVSRKGKRRNEGPARKRYWMVRTLEKHKIKALMRQGMTRAKALIFWHEVRIGRVPNGFIYRADLDGE